MAYKRTFSDPSRKKDLGSGVAGGGGQLDDPNASSTTGTNSWVNLQTYLEGNKGQGAGIANAITQKTQADIDAVGAKQTEWQQKAAERVDQNTKKDTWSDQIKSDPTKVDNKAFGAWKQLGNYWGAKDAAELEDYGDVYNSTQKAEQDVAAATDYYGQKALADRTFGQNGANYTQGMNTLDVFTANADASGKQAFQSFKDKNAGKVSQQWNSTLTGVNDYIGGAEARGQQSLNSALGAVTGKRTGINAAAQQRADANTDKSEAYKKLSGGSPSAMLSPELMDRYITGRNANYGADEEYTDVDLAALNALAGLDGGPRFSKGADARYNVNVPGYIEYLNSLRNKTTPGETDPLPVKLPLPSDPPPSASDPLPTPMPVEPAPNPSPTAPTPTPIITGPATNPTPTNPNLGGYNPGTPSAVRTDSGINYSGPRPAGWPEWMPWPPKF